MGRFTNAIGRDNDQTNFDYTNLSGNDLISNASFLEDLRKYYNSKGESFASTSDMLDDWYTDNRWKDSNFLSAGLDMAEYNSAGSNQALMTRLSKAWQNAPTRGSVGKRVLDYGLATIADPINLVPYAGAASKASKVAKAARLAGKTKNQAVSAAVKAGARRGALLEGTVGAGLGAGFEGVQQSRQMQQGLRDEFDTKQIGTAALLEGALSGAIGAPLGALASKAPAERALDWRNGTPLSEKINARTNELNEAEKEAQRIAADDTLAQDVRQDAQEELLDIEKEKQDLVAATNKAVALDKKLEGDAAKIEAGRNNGDDVSAAQAQYDADFKAFNEMLASTDIERVARLDNADIQANRKAAAQTTTTTKTLDVEKAKKTAADAQRVMDGDAAKGNETGEVEGTGTEGEEKPAAEAAPKIPTVPEIPDVKAVKYKTTVGKDGWTQQIDKSFKAHVEGNKVKKANEKNGTNNKPLTKAEVGKILAADEAHMKDGKITAAGRQAINIHIAAREGRTYSGKTNSAYSKQLVNELFDTPVRKDEASFADPKLAQAEDAIADAKKPVTKEPEIAEVSEAAQAVFEDILNQADYYNKLNTTSVKRRLSAIIRAADDDGTPIQEDIVAAVRRRIALLEGKVGETFKEFKSQNQVAKFRKNLGDAAGTEDLKYTPNRVADRTAKAGEKLGFDKYAGRVFKDYIDPKTGEKKTTSKINKLFRVGMDLGDDRTITEGMEIFQTRNETRELAKARAETDFAQGKLKGLYPFPARAGLRLPGGKIAEEGQQVYGVLIDTKAGTRFYTYEHKTHAMDRLGITKPDEYVIVDDNIEGISVREDFERMMDEAEKKFSKHGDADKFDDETKTIKAQAVKGGLDVDTPKEKIVDGKGNDVTLQQDVPDIPVERGDMVLAILPKTLELKPRVISQSQIDNKDGIQKLLGKKGIENYNIGYVPREIDGKKIHSNTDRDIIKSVFEPLDDANDIGAQPAPKTQEAALPNAPMDYKVAAATKVDIARLSSSPEGKRMAMDLYMGARLIDSDMVEEKLDDFLVSQPSLQVLDEILGDLEGNGFVKEVAGFGEVPFGQRLQYINSYLRVLEVEAPLGLRRPNTNITQSVKELKKLTGTMSKTAFSYIDKMMRAIVPGDIAPKFRPIEPSEYEIVMSGLPTGTYTAFPEKSAVLNAEELVMGNKFNTIALDPSRLDHTGEKTGVTSSFVIMHELGHWAYKNLLTPDLKREFWSSVSKYYDKNGKFDGGFVSDNVEGTLLDAYSPLVELQGKQAGALEAKSAPSELFANQFALWAHHKYGAPLAAKTADGNFWERAAKVVKKLWMHITNRHIVDPDMEAIFEKMIADKAEVRRVRYTDPKMPMTKLGQSLRVRYDEISKAIRAFEEAREGYPDMHDPEKMGMAARALSNSFAGIAMTKTQRAIAARRDGRTGSTEAERVQAYTGAFRAISGHRKMRNYAALINEKTASIDYTVSQTGDDMVLDGSVYHTDMPQNMIELWDGGLGKYAKGKLVEINDAYLNVEYGDIPEVKFSDEILSMRESRGLTEEKIKKITNMKKVKRVVNMNRAKFKQTMTKIMKDEGKSNAKKFNGEVVKGTKGNDPNKYTLMEALAEYRRQIGSDGTPTDFGAKLSRRVQHIVKTKVKDVVLTDEEKAIFNKMQSQEKAKGGGNQGVANRVQQPEITLSMAISADGEKIKGLGATPEQAMNIMQHLIRTRAAARAAKRASRESETVQKAIIIEQAQDAGTSYENGIPSNANLRMREYLRGITHRNNTKELVARTVTARLARLGVESLPQSVDAPSYASYRKVVRGVSSNLSTNDDITQAVKFVGEALYSSHSVSHSTRNLFSKASTILNTTPEKLFADVLSEASDIQAKPRQLNAIENILDGDDADLFQEFLEELDNEIAESAGYVLNGMIKSPAARERFANITVFGDMLGSATPNKGSPRSRYGDRVPAEYAEDHAHELIGDFTASGYSAIREFTNDKVMPYYYNGTANGVFGAGNYVRLTPNNTIENTREAIISSVSPEAKEAAIDLVDAIDMARAKVNSARVDPNSSSVYIDKMYMLDDILTEELLELGASIDTTVEPVFVRDTMPAVFSNSMTGNHPIVKALSSHLNSVTGSMRKAQEIESIRGVYTGEEMIQQLTEIMGSTRKLKRAFQEAGYTSLNLGEEKMMLARQNMRNVRSDVFENATPLIGEKARTHSVNGRIVQAVNDGDAIRVLSQGAAELEDAGVPARSLEAMMSVARGRGMPSEAAQEIRKQNLFNPLHTNAKIMDRSGLGRLANFFEPKDGSGGHFERTNAKMGKFVIPLTRMLKKLPDSSSKLKTYWRTGPQMMAESAMGAMGINPKRRMSQPPSHIRILDALRNKDVESQLLPEEREVYEHVRGYLDEATGRLQAAGALVGNIRQNYFPQIWRKDLIEADPEEFVRRLKKYFLAERNGTGEAAKAESSARRVLQRLLDEDGVFSNPAQNFKRMSQKAGDQSDHLDYNRLIRLDEFPEFANYDMPDSLGVFLENDLLVAMTKYSDNLEHRIDITNEFGVGAHGYHDYMAILSQPMNARQTIGKLLSSNKIITTTWARSGMSEQGVKENTFDNNLFYAPIKEQIEAERKADELISMAQQGATGAELEANIMSLLGDNLAGNADAEMLRNNFRKRASAIAGALADTEGLQKITSNRNLQHAQGFMNASMRRPIDGIHGTFSMRNASKWLRGVNAVTLLGFTTLTSLGDLVLPLIRTGDFGAYTKALRKFALDPEYRDMIRNVGAATENAVHQRLTVAHGVDSTQFMTGFFNSTLLTPWTDMMRDVAGAVSYEHLKAQHKIVQNRPNSRAGRIARRILREEGLAEFIDDPTLDMDLIMESRFSGNEHPKADKLSAAAIKLTNQMIFTPNPNDIPLWAQTPLGAMAFQLKSYPLMMSRLGGTVLGEAFRGRTPAERGKNFAKAFVGASDNRLGPLAALLVAGPAMGGVAVGTKDIIQGRGGEDNREFTLRERKLSETLTAAFEENEDLDMLMGWYFDGMVALGGLGLVGELFYDIASQTDNGAYGSQRILETLGGPTVGLFNDATTVLQGGRSWWDDKEANGERRAAVREIAGRVPVLGGVSWAKEGIVDTVAGERGKKGGKSGGWGGGWTGSGWG